MSYSFPEQQSSRCSGKYHLHNNLPYSVQLKVRCRAHQMYFWSQTVQGKNKSIFVSAAHVSTLVARLKQENISIIRTVMHLQKNRTTEMWCREPKMIKADIVFALSVKQKPKEIVKETNRKRTSVFSVRTVSITLRGIRNPITPDWGCFIKPSPATLSWCWLIDCTQGCVVFSMEDVPRKLKVLFDISVCSP